MTDDIDEIIDDPLGEDRAGASGCAPDAHHAANARHTYQPHPEDSARAALLAILPPDARARVVEGTRHMRDDDPMWGVMYAVAVSTAEAQRASTDEAVAAIQAAAKQVGSVASEIESGRAAIAETADATHRRMVETLDSFGTHATQRMAAEREAIERVIEDVWREATREVAQRRAGEIIRAVSARALTVLAAALGLGIGVGIVIALTLAAAGRMGAL
ncbi:hypothetical protein [Arhodomonas sp. SL1]|uniref:hypothetical protein n=1 Tax=Arhodomonas sp. SL1 TaxID=3425691 RepID=UPI003F8813A8